MPNNIQQTLLEAQTAWMDIEGVESVGQGKKDGRDCIVVYVSEKSPTIEQQIPEEYKQVPVDIRESGIISAQ